MMTDIELLEKYIKKLLTNNELINFELRLKTEPSLLKKLKLLQQLKDYTFKKEKQEVELQLNNIAKKYKQKKRKRKTIYMYSLIAASIAVLIFFTFNYNDKQKPITSVENIDTAKQIEKQIKNSIPTVIDNNKYIANNVKDITYKKEINKKIQTKTYYVLDYSKQNDNEYGFVPQTTDSFKIKVYFYKAAIKKYKRTKNIIYLKGNFNSNILFYKEKDNDLIMMQFKDSIYTLMNSMQFIELSAKIQ